MEVYIASKAFLHIAMILNLIYAFAMVIIFSFQSWIYELAVYDLREQTLFPLYNIVEAVVTFAVVTAMIILLKNNQEQEDKKRTIGSDTDDDRFDCRSVDILGKAAMVFVLAHAAITYGSKKKQDS